MEGSLKDLAYIRFERAHQNLAAAKSNLELGDYKTALNRSYYAIFHAIRAVNCMSGFDSSKHSGVIAYFNQNTVKTGKIDSDYSKIIKSASYCREKSDYDDFYVVSKKETEEQIENAVRFLNEIDGLLQKM